MILSVFFCFWFWKSFVGLSWCSIGPFWFLCGGFTQRWIISNDFGRVPFWTNIQHPTRKRWSLKSLKGKTRLLNVPLSFHALRENHIYICHHYQNHHQNHPNIDYFCYLFHILDCDSKSRDGRVSSGSASISSFHAKNDTSSVLSGNLQMTRRPMVAKWATVITFDDWPTSIVATLPLTGAALISSPSGVVT